MFGDTTDTWKNQKAAEQKNRFLEWLKLNEIDVEPSLECSEVLSISSEEEGKPERKGMRKFFFSIIYFFTYLLFSFKISK
jgi:hypothetical protein